PVTCRPGSPRFGFSTFTTSAPNHARASVQVGPASNCVRSTTFTPFRQLRGAKFPLILLVSSTLGTSPEQHSGRISQDRPSRKPSNSANRHATTIDLRPPRSPKLQDCGHAFPATAEA